MCVCVVYMYIAVCEYVHKTFLTGLDTDLEVTTEQLDSCSRSSSFSVISPDVQRLLSNGKLMLYYIHCITKVPAVFKV